MRLRPTTAWLSACLSLSLAANAWLSYVALDDAVTRSYMEGEFHDILAERDALRRLVLRMAAGEDHRTALLALASDKHAFEREGWLVAHPLSARFDGDVLVAVCGTVVDKCPVPAAERVR